jgi:hypothetical protein
LRFALFVDNKCRREERALKTLPRAVTLKRFATDLRVLLRAMGFGIGEENRTAWDRGNCFKLQVVTIAIQVRERAHATLFVAACLFP